ncbi:hypothetical protein L211DRAFT_810173 [Terfezia boudieri ATCC MYA-4762]|uniref:Uncharacterized protein n=1 Tax=Terfezia boudieri ATCC MYA-4762 TaxID=1051890 RepID=A0A3N4LIV0_9PEZI|nr:hypothetical protein L211DRAFT_810173 [Terfezia boudieri ATCC MYA-4762]
MLIILLVVVMAVMGFCFSLVGHWLVPRIYRGLRGFYYAVQRPQQQQPRPLSRITHLLLELLSVTCVLALFSTVPYFHPENILSRTRSSITRSTTEGIFEHLHSVRPPIPSDEILKARFVSRAGRVLYSAYGPGPLINCTWCGVDQPFTYTIYALPSILLPHLIHTAILGVVTSAEFLGENNEAGGVWRTHATCASIVLALGEGWYIYVYTSVLNERAATDARFPYWQLLTIRGIAFAILDAALGYAIYLTGTGRWSGSDENSTESLEKVVSKLENSLVAANTAICLKQAIMRDYELRARAVQFWEKEELYAKEVAKDDHVRIARVGVERRKDWVRVKEDAKRQASAIVRELFGEVGPMEGTETEGGWQTEGSETGT